VLALSSWFCNLISYCPHKQFVEQLAAFDIEIEGWKKALKSNA
jgi:hypothetical protein